MVSCRTRAKTARSVDAAARAFDVLTEGMATLDFSNGFGAVWDLIRAANSYIEDKQPWALNKAGDTVATAAVLGDCLEALRIVALLSSPLIPRASAELWRRLGLPGNPADERLPDAAQWGLLPRGVDAREGRATLSPHRDVTWVDSHCHLPSLTGGAEAALDRARAAGVERVVCVGTDLASSAASIELAAAHDDVSPTVGLHPHDASKLAAEWDAARGAGEQSRVVAIGETGFDLYYEHSPVAEQEAAFRAQIALAHSSASRS